MGTMTLFGQIVIGPPGSGKTTYCKAMAEFLSGMGRKVAVFNLDPANDILPYDAAADISNLISVNDVMENMDLGPNGGLVYCMEYLEKNMDWLLTNINRLKGHYFILDMPGQVELFTHHTSVKNITQALQKFGLRLAAVHLVDAHYCSDSGKFISVLVTSLTTMLRVELPHVNVLSKVDLAEKNGRLRFGLDFYSEVMDLSYLLEDVPDDPFTRRYVRLTAALSSLVQNYSLVSFLPLCVNDKVMVQRVMKAVDKSNGYIFGSEERQSTVQNLLACAVGAERETDRLGRDRDKYT